MTNPTADSTGAFASRAYMVDACRYMPGGVSSPVRSFSGVGGVPRVIRRADGCRMTDLDGRTYIDYVGSWGAMIAGHGHPAVKSAAHLALEDGVSFGTPTPGELDLAREITARIPGVEMVRFVNSGTEATMSVIRLARAVTGRDRIVKFIGCYHGHADGLLIRAGSGAATLGIPDSPGVPAGVATDTLTCPYNDLASVERLLSRLKSSIAAIIVEPVAGNMGVVLPEEGFLDGLRRMSREHGSLLIFDEVMTGFRIDRGGAVKRFGITPDLVTLGKIIGGGLPVGAYGGPRDLMNQVAPSGPVYQAGTLAGNPLAMCCGLSTLRLLDQSAYDRLERASRRLEEGLKGAIVQTGCSARIQRAGSMLTLFFSQGPVRDFTDAQRSDRRRFARFFHGMLDRGVHLPPSAFEAWFLSLAHDDEAIDLTVSAAAEVLSTMAEES